MAAASADPARNGVPAADLPACMALQDIAVRGLPCAIQPSSTWQQSLPASPPGTKFDNPSDGCTHNRPARRTGPHARPAARSGHTAARGLLFAGTARQFRAHHADHVQARRRYGPRPHAADRRRRAVHGGLRGGAHLRDASRASAPLQAQCRSGVEAGHGIEVVDVCHEPEPALRDGICMTHTLPKPAPVAVGQVVGMLSAAATMVQALGLPEKRTTAS